MEIKYSCIQVGACSVLMLISFSRSHYLPHSQMTVHVLDRWRLSATAYGNAMSSSGLRSMLANINLYHEFFILISSSLISLFSSRSFVCGQFYSKFNCTFSVIAQVVSGEKLEDLNDVIISLKTGVVLCKLINILVPGAVKKYSTTRLMALTERANIDEFLKALQALGIPNSDLFATSDLHNGKGITNVFHCLQNLHDLALKRKWTVHSIAGDHQIA
jgi:hypothetical protein